MTQNDRTEISLLMQHYFDGLYYADSMLLRRVFHPELLYVNATKHREEFMELDAYMSRVDGRTSPASLRHSREEHIERVTLKNERIGIVEAQMRMFGRTYQDVLTVMRSQQGWQVLSKVFSHTEKEE